MVCDGSAFVETSSSPGTAPSSASIQAPARWASAAACVKPDVVLEAQVRAVDHHRRVAGVEAALHFRQVPAVIEMHADQC
jgi:hypothetical protein